MTRANRVSRVFTNTPAENRKFDRWAEKLMAEGFTQTGMKSLPLRKGETLRSPARWRYTFERRGEIEE